MKPRFFFLFITLIAINISAAAQKVYTKNGAISFFSKAPIENINADNNEVVSLLDEQTGELQFSILIKSFHFKKSLMEEHFNENYMESNKYPKASFKGKIIDLSKVNFTTDGNYIVSVSGDLTMHGITNKVTETGTINIKAGIATATSKFKIKLTDFNISIPGVVKNNIAEVIDVTVSWCTIQKM